LSSPLFANVRHNMKKIGQKENVETGILLSLVSILTGLYRNEVFWFKAAATVLIVVLSVPVLFKPVAVAWFSLAHFLNKGASAVLLVIIYSVFVVPAALIRRVLGKDSLLLRKFKNGTHSVFSDSDHIYHANDVTKPY
jgi:hypothetical protein